MKVCQAIIINEEVSLAIRFFPQESSDLSGEVDRIVLSNEDEVK